MPLSIFKDGRIYNFVLRDKVIPEDSYLVLVKASAFAISQSQPFNGKSPDRAVKDFMIKNTVVI